MIEQVTIDREDNAGALNALFAWTARNAQRVVIPINHGALREGHSGLAFYCVHSLSGAGGSDFHDLARLMPDIRFYGVHAPLAKMHDTAFGSIVEPLADYYAAALMRFQPNGPFFLGGWSAGAIIALEIAQSLLASGREVGLLAAIDAAPENTGAGLRLRHPLYWLKLAGNLPGWIIHEKLIEKEVLLSLAWRLSRKVINFSKAIVARTRGEKLVGGNAVEGFVDLSRYPPVQSKFMKRLYDALMEYQPRPYAGKVVVYEADVGPLLHLPQTRAIWRDIAPQSVTIPVSGTHSTILRQPHVRTLAADLQNRIIEAVTDKGR